MNIKAIRKELHKYPEISGNEEETAQKIKDILREIGVQQVHSKFSQQSILAEINGDKPGNTILFRCELDALPIKELNDFSYHSKNNGVSHKCGHDGHMAILLALAHKLINHPPAEGKFLLLFQSAEETGEGARSIIESGFLDAFNIDYALSLHNVPGYNKKSIVCKENEFTPSVESFEVMLKGETSHAGEPDKGKNPANCIAEIIDHMQSLHQPNPKDKDYFVVAPIHINMGKRAYGTSAGRAKIGYTIRAVNHNDFIQRKIALEKKIRELAQKHSLQYSIGWKEAFASNNNHKNVVKLIEKAARQLDLEYIHKEDPFDWGEDFGLFTQHYSGAMFGLGSGKETPPLHDANYDFPDEIIETGKDIFYSLANELQL